MRSFCDWVWRKEPMELAAQVLDETEDILVVYPQTSIFVEGSILVVGVNILDKKAVTVKEEAK